MKKIFIILMLLTIYLGFNKQDVKAIEQLELPFFFEMDTPRFSYRSDNQDLPNFLQFSIYEETPELPNLSYDFVLEQIDTKGDLINVLEEIELTTELTDISPVYPFSAQYETYTSNKEYSGGNEVYWRLRYDNYIIMTGAIFNHPEWDDYGDNKIAIGDYVYASDGDDIYSNSPLEEFLYNTNNDDYYILHYRLGGNFGAQGYDFDVNIYDTINDSNNLFSMDEIVRFNSGSFISPTVRDKNSFIPLGFDGEIPDFLLTDVEVYNDISLINPPVLTKGIYEIGLIQTFGETITTMDGADELLIYSDRNVIAETILNNDVVSVFEDINITLFKYDLTLFEGLTTIKAQDSILLIDYSDEVNLLNKFGVSYLPSDTMIIDDVGNFEWLVRPVNTKFNNEAYYEYDLGVNYVISEDDPFINNITNIRMKLGLNDNTGAILISTVIILFTMIALLKLGANGVVIFIIAMIESVFFRYINFVPDWFVIGIAVMCIFTILINLSRSE